MRSSESEGTGDAYLYGPVPLPPEEALDDEELGLGPDEGYSPGERPRGVTAWGTTASEQLVRQDLATRLMNEEPDVRDRYAGDGIGDSEDSDGEPIDDQVGDFRAGRLAYRDFEPTEPDQEYWAVDVGIDGGGASAEEAAMHIIPDGFDYVGEDDLPSGQDIL